MIAPGIVSIYEEGKTHKTPTDPTCPGYKCPRRGQWRVLADARYESRCQQHSRRQLERTVKGSVAGGSAPRLSCSQACSIPGCAQDISEQTNRRVRPYVVLVDETRWLSFQSTFSFSLSLLTEAKDPASMLLLTFVFVPPQLSTQLRRPSEKIPATILSTQ